MSRPGRSMFGVELRVVDDAGKVLPRDGKSSGRLQTRGAGRRPALFQAGRGLRRRGQLVRHRRHRRHPSRQHAAAHRPRQGRDQVGRRVDQLDRARECGGRLSRRGRGRGDRHPASQMGRAAAAAGRPRSGKRRVGEAEIRDFLSARWPNGGCPTRSSSSTSCPTPRPASSARRICATNIAITASPMPRRWSGRD